MARLGVHLEDGNTLSSFYQLHRSAVAGIHLEGIGDSVAGDEINAVEAYEPELPRHTRSQLSGKREQLFLLGKEAGPEQTSAVAEAVRPKASISYQLPAEAQRRCVPSISREYHRAWNPGDPLLQVMGPRHRVSDLQHHCTMTASRTSRLE